MKNRMKLFFLILISLLYISTIDIFSSNNTKFTNHIVVGYNIGATTPVSMPREVRSITSFWPQFNPLFGYNFWYKINEEWSIGSGAIVDLKGMGIRNKVKYMHTDVVMEGNNIKGYFTGRNETTTKIAYISVPIRISYQFADQWKVRGGISLSYKYNSEFYGTVWDGVLIETTNNEDIINGTKIEVPYKNKAIFDFGKEVRDFELGLLLGASHNIPKSRFDIFGDFSYGLTPIFNSDFKAIEFKMRNIYLALGLNYSF